MSFSDRRRDGDEGRGMEGKYIPWGVIRAEFLWLDARTSVSDRWTSSGLCLTSSWWVTMYMGKPSAVGHITRPTQPFILSGVDKWVVSCNQMAAITTDRLMLDPVLMTSTGTHPFVNNQQTPEGRNIAPFYICSQVSVLEHSDSQFESIRRFVLLKNQPFDLAAAFAWSMIIRHGIVQYSAVVFRTVQCN